MRIIFLLKTIILLAVISSCDGLDSKKNCELDRKSDHQLKVPNDGANLQLTENPNFEKRWILYRVDKPNGNKVLINDSITVTFSKDTLSRFCGNKLLETHVLVLDERYQSNRRYYFQDNRDHILIFLDENKESFGISYWDGEANNEYFKLK